MKKVLKIALFVLASIILVIGIFVSIISIKGIPTYSVGNLDIVVSTDSLTVEKGRKIANMLCIHCHMDGETKKLTGRYVPEAPELGKFYSKNITQHPEKGIGAWSDGALIYYLRTGIKPDGSFGLPPMIRLPNISDEDINALVAFLKSDSPIVAPSEIEAPESEPSFLLKVLTQFAVKPLPYPEKNIITPDTSDLIAHGEYLVNDQLLCYACHSASFQTLDELNPTQSEGYLAGGNPMFTDDEKPIKTRNITMDVATGIGKWTKEEFKTAVKHGKKPDGGTISTPMIPYPNLSDRELEAIYAYLQTAPKIENMVK